MLQTSDIYNKKSKNRKPQSCTNIKVQPLEHVHQHRTQQLKQNQVYSENYPIVQHTDVTLNTNKTEPFTPNKQNGNYAELIKNIKISFPAMDDFVPKSPKTYDYF